MEVKGKIIAVLPLKNGQSKTGKDWMSQEYVIETEEQYPHRLCFSVFGDERIKQFGIKLGQYLTVKLDFNSREYQGKWFNEMRAWGVELDNTRVQPSTPSAQTDDDSRPF